MPPNALYSLGLTYERQGLQEQSLLAFQRVLELNPGNEDIENKIKDIEAGNLDIDEVETEEVDLSPVEEDEQE